MASTLESPFATRSGESNHILTKSEIEPTRGLVDQIRGQLEFYFSEVNYPKDRWMIMMAKKNADGYIPLEAMLKFNRVSNMIKDHVNPTGLLVDAVRTSDVLTLNEEQSMLKRKEPLPDNIDLDSRSLFISHIPIDKSDTDDSLSFELIKHLLENIAPVSCVRLHHKRNGDTRLPRGTAVAIMKSVGDKDKVLAECKDEHLEWVDKEKQIRVRDKITADREHRLKRFKGNKSRGHSDKKKGESGSPRRDILSLGLESKSLPLQSIQDKFSMFGEISSVARIGSDIGPIIRFHKEEDAQKALEAVTNGLVIDSIAITAALPEPDQGDVYLKRAGLSRSSIQKRCGKRNNGHQGLVHSKPKRTNCSGSDDQVDEESAIIGEGSTDKNESYSKRAEDEKIDP